MNTKQASLLLEQAIDVCQKPPNLTSSDDLMLVAGLLLSFRDGWFAARRAGADRKGPRVPAVPPLTEFARAVGRTHRAGVPGPLIVREIHVGADGRVVDRGPASCFGPCASCNELSQLDAMCECSHCATVRRCRAAWDALSPAEQEASIAADMAAEGVKPPSRPHDADDGWDV